MMFSELPTLDIFGAEFADNPRQFLSAAAARGPLARSGRGLEILDYDLCQAALRDRDLGRNHMDLIRRLGLPPGPAFDFNQGLLNSQKGEVRNRLRLCVARQMGPQPAQQMREAIRKMVARLLDEATKDAPIDLTAICSRLPAEVYCYWVGAPREDAPFVSKVSDDALLIFRQEPKYGPQIVAGFEALIPYVAKRIEEKKHSLGDDLLSRLINENEAGSLSDDELHNCTGMLLIASTDNTANQMALILANLLEHEDQWRLLMDAPSLVRNAVEEGIRFQSRMVSHTRVVFEKDFEIGGVAIEEGVRVFPLVWAAHLNEAKFPNPLKLDVTRAAAPGPLTFGGGVYNCLGQHVARIELQEMVLALASRFPGIRLHGAPGRHHTPFVSWVSKLPVVLGAERG